MIDNYKLIQECCGTSALIIFVITVVVHTVFVITMLIRSIARIPDNEKTNQEKCLDVLVDNIIRFLLYGICSVLYFDTSKIFAVAIFLVYLSALGLSDTKIRELPQAFRLILSIMIPILFLIICYIFFLF